MKGGLLMWEYMTSLIMGTGKQAGLDDAFKFIQGNIIKFILALVYFKAVNILGNYIKQILKKFLTKIKLDKTVSDITLSAFSVLYYIWNLYSVLKFLGVNSKDLTTFLGTTGIISAVAFRDSLSTLASSVMILTFKPFKVGDYVEILDYTGKIEKINLFYTRLTTFQNETVNIPNRMLTEKALINHSKEKVRRADFLISVPYSENVTKVKQVIDTTIMNLQAQNSNILKKPNFTSGIETLHKNSVKFFIYVYIKNEKSIETKSFIAFEIKKAFDRAKIKFLGNV